jgi:enoyl-CoA hydratase/carnithine racemase
MSEKENLSEWDERIEPLPFEEYSEKYKDLFVMTGPRQSRALSRMRRVASSPWTHPPSGSRRSEGRGPVQLVGRNGHLATLPRPCVMTRRDGIIELRMHTNGGPFQQTWKAHNAWNHAWLDVGRDPENEVLIITGTGDRWLTADLTDIWRTPFHDWTDDSKLKMYYDMIKLLENLVFSIDIPTIAAINGPGGHTEIGIMCDITLVTEDTNFFDPHFMVGSPSGDGLALTLQQTMGIKRASYYAYTGKKIDGRTAVELGIANEVLPRERLLPRAWELAEMIMERPRHTRRMNHAILSRPWKRALVNDLGFHVAHQLFPMSLDKEGVLARLQRYGHRP